MEKTGRNRPCPCGSGRKYKHCCLRWNASKGERAADRLELRTVLALNDLGNALRLEGRAEDAILCYEKAAAIAPAFAPARYNLAKALSDLGMLEESAMSYQHAVRLDPGFADAWNSLGIILWELGRPEEAATSLRAAIRLRPQFAEARFNLHSALVDPRDLSPAIEQLRKVAALMPDSAEVHFHLGMLLDYSGERRDALAHLDIARSGPAHARAALDSYEYIRSVMGRPPALIGCPRDAFRIGLACATRPGLVLEFGVRFGTSIRQIADLAGQQVHGFDSFQGLPEAWHGEPPGSYSTRGCLPAVPPNVTLHRGWFHETLPAFLSERSGAVRFMNVDCDLYSATRTVLDLLAGRIVPGSVIAFDDYLGYEHWREDEFRAFQECAQRYAWRYEYLAFSLCTRQAVVRVL